MLAMYGRGLDKSNRMNYSGHNYSYYWLLSLRNIPGFKRLLRHI
jgi:hypothetical protein